MNTQIKETEYEKCDQLFREGHVKKKEDVHQQDEVNHRVPKVDSKWLEPDRKMIVHNYSDGNYYL